MGLDPGYGSVTTVNRSGISAGVLGSGVVLGDGPRVEVSADGCTIEHRDDSGSAVLDFSNISSCIVALASSTVGMVDLTMLLVPVCVSSLGSVNGYPAEAFPGGYGAMWSDRFVDSTVVPSCNFVVVFDMGRIGDTEVLDPAIDHCVILGFSCSVNYACDCYHAVVVRGVVLVSSPTTVAAVPLSVVSGWCADCLGAVSLCLWVPVRSVVGSVAVGSVSSVSLA